MNRQRIMAIMASATTGQNNKVEVGVSVWACTMFGWCVPVLCFSFLCLRFSCTGSCAVDSVDGERVRWSYKSCNY